MADHSPKLVSIHGGHSGQFCSHATDTLEEIVQTYVDKGFTWVGLTEHIPPVSDAFLYSDDIAAGLSAAAIDDRFANYISIARDLQDRYKDSIRILVGFETECCTGYEQHVKELRDRFQPDYIVGSVHHVRDVGIDGSLASYEKATTMLGGVEALYCEYFDQQLQILEVLAPEVVGHFDLIRIHDPDYHERLEDSGVRERIFRNLEKIRALGSILDFNVRAYERGGSEPYVAPSILKMALDLGIPCVPGDDSHSIAGAGLHVQRGIAILQEYDFSTDWPIPGNNRSG